MKNLFQGTFCRGTLALLLALAPLHAQNILLKDGRTLEGKNLRRNGATIMTAVQGGTGQGEMGIPVDTITRIEFPEPPQLAAATKMLLQGKAAEALPQIDQLVAQQTPFKDIPGNWWAQAAILDVSLLQSVGRDQQAGPVIGDLIAYVADPETVLAGKVKQAASLVKKDPKKAMAVFTTVLKESSRPEILAEAWLNTGSARLAAQEFQPALLAYLHLPVFYPGEKLLVPPALLGSSRAYVGLDDFTRAKRALDELLRDFPDSPEAAAAKSELPSIERKLKGKESAQPSKKPSAT